MLTRIFAIFRARNLEFIRDRSSMSWNIILPVVLMFGLSFIFGGADRTEYRVGVLQSDEELNMGQHPFLATRYIQFVVINDEEAGFRRIARHRLDLLVQFDEPASYWVNPESPKGYFAELALLQSENPATLGIQKAQITGDPVRYVDWVLPGILGMNMMFSCLFGVGYVVVRYRKNGFLKRLRATPLRAIEFVIAQVASRLVLIMLITSFVYIGTNYFLDTRMDGSYIALFLVAFVGAIALLAMGLLVASRVTSEELAGGLLNLFTWPMMLLSGVWFPLEDADAWVRQVANIFPLTHVLNSARSVMLDGATLLDVTPALISLLLLSMLFLGLGAAMFRWRAA
jgi:ABC-2 type transport system permease protein